MLLRRLSLSQMVTRSASSKMQSGFVALYLFSVHIQKTDGNEGGNSIQSLMASILTDNPAEPTRTLTIYVISTPS